MIDSALKSRSDNWRSRAPLTTHHSPLTTHHSPLTTHRSPTHHLTHHPAILSHDLPTLRSPPMSRRLTATVGRWSLTPPAFIALAIVLCASAAWSYSKLAATGER